MNVFCMFFFLLTVSCTGIMGKKIFAGENVVLKSSRIPAADVIFVVQETKYSQVVGSRLADIVKHIQSILEQKGKYNSQLVSSLVTAGDIQS